MGPAHPTACTGKIIKKKSSLPTPMNVPRRYTSLVLTALPVWVPVRYRPAQIMNLFLVLGSERLTPIHLQVGGVHGYMTARLADPAPLNPPVTDTGDGMAHPLGGKLWQCILLCMAWAFFLATWSGDLWNHTIRDFCETMKRKVFQSHKAEVEALTFWNQEVEALAQKALSSWSLIRSQGCFLPMSAVLPIC